MTSQRDWRLTWNLPGSQFWLSTSRLNSTSLILMLKRHFQVNNTTIHRGHERIEMHPGGNGIPVRMIIVHRSFMYLLLSFLTWNIRIWLFNKEKFISTNSMLSDPFPSILLYTTSSKSPFSSCSDPLVLLAPNLT